MAEIRVIIADDSMLARTLLRDFLESDPAIRVVGEAGNGREAVELVHRLSPDLVTMDLEMPVMGGLEAIGEIMATRAVPILVVSGVADAQKAYAAVAAGALEVIGKPEASTESRDELVAKVRMLSGVKVITHLRGRRSAFPPARLVSPLTSAAVPPTAPAPAGNNRLFAIASSTGGPQALAAILPRLPADFGCPVVIAQHISEGFAGGLCDWLAPQCKIKVRLAGDGASLLPGIAWIAPSESDLVVVEGARLALQSRPPQAIYRPSCDALLASAATVFGPAAVGIILTGMGSDGAAGLGRIRDGGGVTLAQDEASSTIFGMNRVAIERGAVHRVLPIDRMAEEMIVLARTAPGPQPAGWNGRMGWPEERGVR